jgi:hypothetical protein
MGKSQQSKSILMLDILVEYLSFSSYIYVSTHISHDLVGDILVVVVEHLKGKFILIKPRGYTT